jgi:hypothetical protein
LAPPQLASLIDAGEGGPWNGYELRLMKEGGRSPLARLVGHEKGIESRKKAVSRITQLVEE